MTEEVCRWVEQQELIWPGDYVVAGVSGGADSVCLLLLLLELRERLGFSLSAMHVEHGIRGEQSGRDAAFVEELCDSMNVPCQIYHVDVPAYAGETGIGLEEAARVLRYECFVKEAVRVGAAHMKVALAHHADDNAETILFQMARGSGAQGLCGMPVQRMLAENVWLIRPMLSVTRAQIETYLHDRGQEFQTDSSNLDIEYSRNRIRHEVLPQLVRVNPQVVQHICRSAGQMREICDYLDGEVDRIWSEVCERQDEGAKAGYLLRLALFEQYHPALVRRMVYRILGQAAGSRRNIASSHVEALIRLAELQAGRRICLPGGLEAVRIYEGICIRHTRAETGCITIDGETTDAVAITAWHLKQAECGIWVSVPLPDGQLRMRVREFCGEMEEIPKKKYTKWLNYDKINCDLWLRKRAGGDYLTIDSEGHTKKLKEYFIEEKIPADCRKSIWLLARDAHVLWVVGGRMSADYRVDPHTDKILEVQMTGGKYCEN